MDLPLAKIELKMTALMTKPHLFIVGTLLVFAACSNPQCDDLIRKLEDCRCENKSICPVNMKDLFNDGDWDKLYIFRGFNTPEDISEAIGFDCSCGVIYDHTWLVLYILDGKLVQNEEFECRDINIDMLLRNGYFEVDASRPFLNLEVRSKKGNIYVLSDSEN